MSESVIIALISLAGTLLGSGGGILVSHKMTNYRLEQLEKKVGEHNNFERRLVDIEKNCATRNVGCSARFESLEKSLHATP